MKVITFWSPKGGVGKTTLAINFAAAAYERGLKPILCDLDPQQSAVDVFNDKRLPFTVLKGKPLITPRADLLILDTPPRTDMTIDGDVVVLPLRASVLDMRAVSKAIRFIHHTKIFRCVNAVDSRRQDERLLAMRMYSEGAFLVKNRSIYPRSISLGRTVFDVNVYGAAEAAAEMLRMFDKVMELEQKE